MIEPDAAEPKDNEPVPCCSKDLSHQCEVEQLGLQDEPSDLQGVNPALFNLDSFCESFALFSLKLESKNVIPSSTVQNIFESINRIHSISQEKLKSDLKGHLAHGMAKEQIDQTIEHLFNADPFSATLSRDGALRSAYKRNMYYTKEFHLNKPVQLSLGLDHSNEMRHYSYVPIKQTLGALLSNPDVLERLSFGVEPSKDGVYREFTNGQVIQGRTFSREKVVQVVLYQDAFQIANPLGSARGRFSMLAVYFTLGNLQYHLRTLADPQQLVLLCHETDFKCFGGNKLFDRLISDLQDLEDGIVVAGQLYIVRLAFICGDNLGSHCIGGFVENFSKESYICRYCVTTMQDFDENTPAELCTISSYNEAVNRASESCDGGGYKGVKHDSPFNRLSSFHVCLSGLPPCLGHDLFEGVVDYDCALMLRHFVMTLKWFSYHHLNATIKSKFKYNTGDQKTSQIR